MSDWQCFLNEMLSQGEDSPQEAAVQYLQSIVSELESDEFLIAFQETGLWLLQKELSTEKAKEVASE